VDLFPIYEEFVEKYFASGYHGEVKPGLHAYFHCGNRVKFDLFKKYHRIAAAGDRHLAEFMPGDSYLNDPQTAKDWQFLLTPVSWRKEDLQNRLEKSRRLQQGEPLPLKASGEEGILLIKALAGLTRVVSNVNLPNVGQIPNLPLGAVVETNAVFAKGSVRPVFAGAVSEELKTLFLPHLENHERILKAALCCDRILVYDAFEADPLVAARKLDCAVIEKLVDDMIENTKAYLPEGWFK